MTRTPAPHRAGGPDLTPLFFARRVGILGLSAREGTWGRVALGMLRQGGFEGEVVAISPRQPDPSVRTVSSMKEAGRLDVVVVAVPAPAVVDAVAQARDADVGAVVVFSSGFAEESEEGRILQGRLTETAGALPVLGPNCLGVVSVPGRLQLSPSVFVAREHGAAPVGLVTQSGAVGFVLADQLIRRGLGFSFYASTGNEACIGAPEIATWLLGRSEVSVVGLYLEALRDLVAYRTMCATARRLGKHIVVLKIGRSAAAQRAALSHTASVTGEWDLFEALSQDEGVTVVPDEESFGEAVHVLCRPLTLPSRLRLGVITMSGGAGAMVADQIADQAEVPEFASATRAKLAATGFPLAGSGNPVDLGGMFGRHLDLLDSVLDAASEDPVVDGLVLYFTFGDRNPDAYRNLAARVVARPLPVWMIWAGAPPGEVEGLAGLGRVFASIPALARGMRAYPRAIPTRLTTILESLHTESAGSTTVQLPSGARSPSGVVTERHAAPFLAGLGLPYVDLATARTTDEAVAAAASLPSPWVLKYDHPQAPHRARLGLLATDITDAAAVDRTARLLLERAEIAGLGGEPGCLVLETQLESVGAFSIGAVYDSQFGPALVIGPGGIDVEVAGARRAVASVPVGGPGFARLAGAAEAAAGCALDLKQLAQAVRAVSRAILSDDVTEVDVNPVLVRPDDTLCAVDALIVTTPGAIAPGQVNA